MKNEIRVLMLEDVATDAALVERDLRKAGIAFSSKRVETREAFLKELGDFCPGIILADYHLPSFDGMAALEIARERCPEVPFLFVSGAIGEERAIEAVKKKATDYVLKDRLSRLATAVRRALGEAEERAGRKQAEESLQVSEEKYSDLVENANDAGCIEAKQPSEAVDLMLSTVEGIRLRAVFEPEICKKDGVKGFVESLLKILSCS